MSRQRRRRRHAPDDVAVLDQEVCSAFGAENLLHAKGVTRPALKGILQVMEASVASALVVNPSILVSSAA